MATRKKSDTNGQVESRHPLAICRPRGDRVVVKRAVRKELTEGGLILPDSARTKQQFGTIVSVGPGRYDSHGERIPMELFAGMEVLITGYAGLEIGGENDPNDEYVLLREEDVLAEMPREKKG